MFFLRGHFIDFLMQFGILFKTFLKIFCFFCTDYSANESSSNPSVKTKYGVIEGFSVDTTLGIQADVFLGIPYAKPPIGNLRFEVSVKFIYIFL